MGSDVKEEVKVDWTRSCEAPTGGVCTDDMMVALVLESGGIRVTMEI